VRGNCYISVSWLIHKNIYYFSGVWNIYSIFQLSEIFSLFWLLSLKISIYFHNSIYTILIKDGIPDYINFRYHKTWIFLDISLIKWVKKFFFFILYWSSMLQVERKFRK
jgi:hypothetical protein